MKIEGRLRCLIKGSTEDPRVCRLFIKGFHIQNLRIVLLAFRTDISLLGMVLLYYCYTLRIGGLFSEFTSFVSDELEVCLLYGIVLRVLSVFSNLHMSMLNIYFGGYLVLVI